MKLRKKGVVRGCVATQAALHVSFRAFDGRSLAADLGEKTFFIDFFAANLT